MRPLFVFAPVKAPGRDAGAFGAPGAPIACAGCSVAPWASIGFALPGAQPSSSAPTAPQDRPVAARSPMAVSALHPDSFGASRAILACSSSIVVDHVAKAQASGIVVDQMAPAPGPQAPDGPRRPPGPIRTKSHATSGQQRYSGIFGSTPCSGIFGDQKQ